jgi:hypothetical protein
VARAPVARIGAAAAAEPWRAAFIGLFAQVLFVPLLVVIAIVLAVTIIGLPLIAVVVPLALAAFFLTLLVGFTSLATRAGEWLEARAGWRVHTGVLAACLGLLLVVLPTLLSRALGVAPEPLHAAAFGTLVIGTAIEYGVWTVGLGAAIMTGFGQWATTPPPVPPTAPADATGMLELR